MGTSPLSLSSEPCERSALERVLFQSGGTSPEEQARAATSTAVSVSRIALTGTPVENRLEELWSQFHFTNPGLLGGRQYFQDQYATPIADGRPDAAKALRTKIRPFLLRRLKSEVAKELPPRTDLILECDLSEDERAVYDAIRAATGEERVLYVGHSQGAITEKILLGTGNRQEAAGDGMVAFDAEICGRHLKTSLLVSLSMF